MSTPKPADSYHHGDLRNALVGEATALAREGGPDAVVLREAVRRAGVSPASAYHHFAGREQLVQAVKQRTLGLLSKHMQSALDQDHADEGADPAGAARRRLRTLGNAYLEFAFSEPGLYRLAFGPRGPWPASEPVTSHDDSVDPFLLLRHVLDELAAAGAVPPERRPGLEYVTWAHVHGLASLCLDGPLVRIDAAQRQAIIEQALDAIIRGL